VKEVFNVLYRKYSYEILSQRHSTKTVKEMSIVERVFTIIILAGFLLAGLFSLFQNDCLFVICMLASICELFT
jgi:predicted nucleic acid-binding protein